jgi:hypothetical protein
MFTAGTLAGLAALSACAADGDSDGSGAPLSASVAALRTDQPAVLEYFFGEGDQRQCNQGPGYGFFAAGMNDDSGDGWSPAVRMDTGAPGGGACTQRFALYDPGSRYADLHISMGFGALGDADAGQCGPTTVQELRHTDKLRVDQVPWTNEIRINTDNRPGGCFQFFKIEGRTDVALDVSFVGDGDAAQCGPVSMVTASDGHPAVIKIDTDTRPGGCRQMLRLRHL